MLKLMQALILGGTVLAWPVFAAERTIVDMAGRSVTVNVPAKRVVTLGSVPVINSFVFALGEGKAIINGLPAFAANPRWRYQSVFAPNLAGAPQMQDANNAPAVETMLQAAPDVAITLDMSTVTTLEKNRLPVLYIAWRQPEDVKPAIEVLAQLFDKQSLAKDYVAYFDATVAKVKQRLAGVAASERPRVVYMTPQNLTNPHLITEWWIPAAGGRSMTANDRTVEAYPFTLEQLVAWDPDVILLPAPGDKAALLAHPVMKELRAAKAGRIHVLPMAAHTWGNRTIEQPLTVMWAASKLYPSLFSEGELKDAVKDFYARFFDQPLSDTQIAEILSGTI